jgi:NAD(P)-dependent dehydrogenase (short-subunit alcohol dehydrogenase family)
MGSLDGKVAIVTGAARGIGKGMATALAKQGAAVTITDVLADTLEAAKSELQKSSGARVLGLLADGRKEDVVKDVVRQTVEQFGRIDLLINNAQTAPSGIPLEKHTAEGLALAFESGFYASFYYMVACLPYLKESKGSVINFGSDAGLWGNAGMVGYNAAKEAIRALTRTAAREWAQYGITVNTIIPGMATEGGAKFFKENPEHYAKRMAQIPLGRLGDPEQDAGSLVVFLASAGAKYLTGETFNINGGVNMRA